ncbi:MAG: LacI family DNA-binding transcriptional regulator [Granulosicoccus sp.]
MNLKELSESLGLSQTTVSRALNGYPEVSEKTRLRVSKAASANNYQPNARAMGLATGRSMTVGHVIPMVSSSDVVNPVFGEFIAGASRTYSQNGYELLLTVAEETKEEETYRNYAASGAVDGVIVHSPCRSDNRIDLLREVGLPFVVHGRVEECTQSYSWVDMNNRRAFRQACQLLLDMGHRRIALVNGREVLNFAWLRLKGYEDALQAVGLALDEELISSGDMTEIYGYETANALLDTESPPTAFVVSSYVVAIGVQRAIVHAGLVIGKDVSVVTHDDVLSFFDNQGEIPQFTATRSSVREAGVQAAQMLLNIIESPESAPQSLLLEARLVVGSSTGPAAAANDSAGQRLT